MKRLTLSSLTLLLCMHCACDASSQKEVKQKLNQAIEGIKTQGGASLGEVEKLHQLEYTVISFPLDSSPQRIEGALDEMGKNRWDCFHVERSLQRSAEGEKSLQLMVFCKRLPETMLRYVPRQLIGR